MIALTHAEVNERVQAAFKGRDQAAKIRELEAKVRMLYTRVRTRDNLIASYSRRRAEEHRRAYRRMKS